MNTTNRVGEQTQNLEASPQFNISIALYSSILFNARIDSNIYQTEAAIPWYVHGLRTLLNLLLLNCLPQFTNSLLLGILPFGFNHRTHSTRHRFPAWCPKSTVGRLPIIPKPYLVFQQCRQDPDIAGGGPGQTCSIEFQ